MAHPKTCLLSCSTVLHFCRQTTSALVHHVHCLYLMLMLTFVTAIPCTVAPQPPGSNFSTLLAFAKPVETSQHACSVGRAPTQAICVSSYLQQPPSPCLTTAIAECAVQEHRGPTETVCPAKSKLFSLATQPVLHMLANNDQLGQSTARTLDQLPKLQLPHANIALNDQHTAASTSCHRSLIALQPLSQHLEHGTYSDGLSGRDLNSQASLQASHRRQQTRTVLHELNIEDGHSSDDAAARSPETRGQGKLCCVQMNHTADGVLEQAQKASAQCACSLYVHYGHHTFCDAEHAPGDDLGTNLQAMQSCSSATECCNSLQCRWCKEDTAAHGETFHSADTHPQTVLARKTQACSSLSAQGIGTVPVISPEDMPHSCSTIKAPKQQHHATALIIVDVQNCFMPTGSLPVPHGDEVVPVINFIRHEYQSFIDVVVLSMDRHPPQHISFISHHKELLDTFGSTIVKDRVKLVYLQQDHGKLVDVLPVSANGSSFETSTTSAAGPQHPARSLWATITNQNSDCVHTAGMPCSNLGADKDTAMLNHDDYAVYTQNLWPDHCIDGTEDANLHPDLVVHPSDIIIPKGTCEWVDGYSAFYDNGHLTDTGLVQMLHKRNITHVVVAGLALDYCVKATAADAAQLGFVVYVLEDASRAVTDEGAHAAKTELERKGVEFIKSSVLPRLMCHEGDVRACALLADQKPVL